MSFSEIKVSRDQLQSTFTLSDTHVTYANTLRRLILTGVETVAFRSDMTATGTTTDVLVKRNDTPMTNEMLADRIGLLPINIKKPLGWKKDDYLFVLTVEGDKGTTRYVKSNDFMVVDRKKLPVVGSDEFKGDEKSEEGEVISNAEFFPPNPISKDHCLIASLQPGSGANQQAIEIRAFASVGTGREHARFCPVSQCTYEYTQDPDPIKKEAMFTKWMNVAKKVNDLDKESERYKELDREFHTMQVKRCFLQNDKGEPFSFDFTIESAGVLEVTYIVERALEVGEQMCNRYVNLRNHASLIPDVYVSSSDSRIIGFDFLFKNHDHTLGNLLQTWLVEKHIEGDAQPQITYAGYSVPHPLRDEMVLRIGVEDGEEATARLAVAEAAKGCAEMFRTMRARWNGLTGAPASASAAASARRRTPISLAKK